MITVQFSNRLLCELTNQRDVARRTNDLRAYRVAQSMIWYAEGKGFKTIAELLNVTRRSVFNWLRRLFCEGATFIEHQCEGGGRKPRLTKAQKQQLCDDIDVGPQANGFETAVWNSALVGDLIFQKFGVSYTPRYLCSLLKQLGFSYQKAGFVTHHADEEAYESQRQHWLNKTWPDLLKQAEQTNAVILFGDEVSFAMWGSLSRTWSRRGQQPLVKTTGIRKGLKVYGAIEFAGGRFHYRESLQYELKPKSLRELKAAGLPTDALNALKTLKGEVYKTLADFTDTMEQVLGNATAKRYQSLIVEKTQATGRFNKEGYIEFLQQLLADYKDQPIILVEDGAPYHRAVLVREFVAEHSEKLSIARLPTFSPDFNPIEKLWKNTKRDATHLKYFKTFEQLRDSVCQTFKGYLAEAARVITVMKSLRQKAGLEL